MPSPKQNGAPSIGKTLRDDFRRSDFKSSLGRDFDELKEYFLDEEQRKRLEEMGRVRRWLFTALWLLKSLFFKLTPARRILFFVAFVFLFVKGNGNNNQSLVGFSALIFLFILMLELKDKLLARDELAAGRAVQQALMPEASPEVPGWSLYLFSQSANEVGGDLVDFIDIATDKKALVLADVSGKGLSAALFTAKLQAILRALAADFSSPSKLCEKINHIFYRDSTPGSFASMVYLELRPDSAELSLVNAGHLPPLILHQGTVTELPKGAAALGLLSGEPCPEQKVHLQAEDLLLVYSDGVTEARNERGDFYGEERFMSFVTQLSGLSAMEAGEKIVYEISTFRGSARAHDDLSIVCLKRR